MMQNRRAVCLHNVMFPVWMLWLFPVAWLVVLPVNFAVDLLVVALAMRAVHLSEVRKSAFTVILRVWIMGFVADFIGTALMFLVNVVELPGAAGKWWYDNLANPVSFHPFSSVYAAAYATLCIAVSAICIYWCNRKFCLQKAGLDEVQKHKVSLALAVFTAPYLFYFPSAWIY